jgi:hypothetical protein
MGELNENICKITIEVGMMSILYRAREARSAMQGSTQVNRTGNRLYTMRLKAHRASEPPRAEGRQCLAVA